MLEVATPGNVSIIYQNLMILAWYDAIPSNWFSKMLWAFDLEKHKEFYKSETVVD
jgi:hypothetical protein